MKHEFDKNSDNFSSVFWLTGLKKRKGDHRHHIKYMMVKDGKLVTTDGVEIREVDVTLPNGFYSVLSRNKAMVTLFKESALESGMFPDYAEILKPDGNIKVTVNSDMVDKGLSIVIRAMADNSFDPLRYLAMFDNMAFSSVTVNPEGNKPAIFKAEGVTAALMPALSR